MIGSYLFRYEDINVKNDEQTNNLSNDDGRLWLIADVFLNFTRWMLVEYVSAWNEGPCVVKQPPERTKSRSLKYDREQRLVCLNQQPTNVKFDPSSLDFDLWCFTRYARIVIGGTEA